MDDGLAALEARVASDLEVIAYPTTEWVPARHDRAGTRLVDVLVVGGGQGGLAVAFKLLRERVANIRVIDRAEPGAEGPWTTYARMRTLRSPKTVNGPDLDIPSLAYQSWHEARFGEAAWRALPKIPKELWAEYLLWFRRVARVPVENRVALTAIEPGDGHLVARLAGPAGAEAVPCRKIVLATGIEGSGGWWAPPEVTGLPRTHWAHSGEAIDLAALRGRRLAVLGAAASAFDSAAAALEAGAASATVFSRRADLQRIQPFRWLSFPGFLRHFHTLDDAWRWRFMRHLLTLREALPPETWARATALPGFRLVTGAPWTAARVEGGAVRIETPAGGHEADFVIAATGLGIDLARCSELAAIAGEIALWRDRYAPPAEEADERLARYPYLDAGFAFTERRAGAAPYLGDIHLFTYGATLSWGPSGASINAMKFAVPHLVAAITRDLFQADVERHWQALQAYRLPEFLLPGEAGEAAAQVPTIRIDAAR